VNYKNMMDPRDATFYVQRCTVHRIRAGRIGRSLTARDDDWKKAKGATPI